MNTIEITKEILPKIVENSPSRFDMAINFYCAIKKAGKYFLVTYFYNPVWALYYPFYDDINKTPILKESKVKTYKDLVEECNQVFNINLKSKVQMAKKRFNQLVGCNCNVKRVNVSYEIKHSKSTNLYTIYKFYNYVITSVQDIQKILNPINLKQKLFYLDKLDNSVVGNAVEFCKKNQQVLIKNAITC